MESPFMSYLCDNSIPSALYNDDYYQGTLQEEKSNPTENIVDTNDEFIQQNVEKCCDAIFDNIKENMIISDNENEDNGGSINLLDMADANGTAQTKPYWLLSTENLISSESTNDTEIKTTTDVKSLMSSTPDDESHENQCEYQFKKLNRNEYKQAMKVVETQADKIVKEVKSHLNKKIKDKETMNSKCGNKQNKRSQKEKRKTKNICSINKNSRNYEISLIVIRGIRKIPMKLYHYKKPISGYNGNNVNNLCKSVAL